MTPIESLSVTQPRIADAAAQLLAVRRGATRPAALPIECAPQSLAEAYAIQREVLRLQGAGIAGWKASLVNAEEGVCAPLAHYAVKAAPGHRLTVEQRTKNTELFSVEPEIAFTLGADLPPLKSDARYERETVMAAVASTHAVIEVLTSRFINADRVSALERAADGLMNEMLIVGPSCPSWSLLKIADLPLTVRVDGKVIHQGRGGHPLGDPLLPLIWLANHLSQQGSGLRAGEIVTTGSCNGVRIIHRGQSVSAFFQGLGAATVTL